MHTPLLASAILAVSLTTLPGRAQQKQPSAQELAAFGLPVFSSEGQRIGRVTQVRAADGQVIPASRFKRQSDRIDLSLTMVEVTKLPAMKP